MERAVVFLTPSKTPGLFSWRILIWVVAFLPLVVTPFYPRSFDLFTYTSALEEGFGPASWVARGATAIQIALGFSLLVYWGVVRRRRPISWGLLIGVGALALGPFLSSFLGISPHFSLGHWVTPLLLWAVLFLPPVPLGWLAREIKKAAFVYVGGSLLAALVVPGWAWEIPYTQGYLPGFEVRLHGVTVHAGQTAPLAWLLFALEVALPSRRRLVRILLLGAALLVLFLIQSKTMWALTALVLGLIPIIGLWNKPTLARLMGVWGAALLGWVMLFAILMADTEVWEPLLEVFYVRSQDLFSLTGRTEIWLVVLEVVRENPWFGYGPHLWDPEMTLTYASWMGWVPAQSHNQYIQVLGEGGIIGLVGLLLYGFVSLGYAWKARAVASGLPFALMVAWFLRGFTESWYRKASADGNVLVHMFLFALVVVAYVERRKGGHRA